MQNYDQDGISLNVRVLTILSRVENPGVFMRVSCAVALD